MAYNGLIHVLLADDHAIVREGLEAMLSDCAAIKVVGEASWGGETLKQVGKVRPDVVLLDVRMPQMDGFGALEELRSKFPQVRVIMLSATAAPQDVAKARKMGAHGFLTKDAECEEVCRTISKVGRGGEHWPPVRKLRASASIKLSRREIQVLQSARPGRSNASIGRILKINEHTVESHVRKLIKKLRVSDLAEAVLRGFEKGLLPQIR